MSSTAEEGPIGPPQVPLDVQVSVVSPEEADHGVAEFWCAGALVGFTRLEAGGLVFCVEPRVDGASVVVGAHSLAEALVEARRLLGGA